MNDDQRTMYSGAISCRNAEVSLRLARTHSFLFINLGGFTFMGAQPTASLQLTVSTIGVILGCLWIATNQLTTKRINYWQEQLALLEEISPEPHPIGVFSGEEYEKVFSRWTRFGNILFALALVTTVGWTALLGMAMRKIQEL